MITEAIRSLIEKYSFVLVATADSLGQPHIAIGRQVVFSEDSLMIFENWFCPSTLQNISCNKRVSVVVVAPDTEKGYQLLGSVVRSTDTASLDGCDPVVKTPGSPQVLTSFTVKINKIFEFTSGIHSDIPIAE